MHDIRIEAIEDTDHVIETASCTKGSVMRGADKSDEIKIMAKLLKLIVDKKNSTTRSDMIHLIEEMDAIRFNRKLINKQLNELKSEHL